ncbi:hypothetical protein L2E82_17401 [Cichorium intybus]|uniref:Uncharacterized protein n=1 Tax=Cichorium intybus TaxID=13427 RepID=A0ACB9F9E3_CICIN|nr:hypothetical protein L2E82_17401 [Cichorium intybus]
MTSEAMFGFLPSSLSLDRTLRSRLLSRSIFNLRLKAVLSLDRFSASGLLTASISSSNCIDFRSSLSIDFKLKLHRFPL